MVQVWRVLQLCVGSNGVELSESVDNLGWQTANAAPVCLNFCVRQPSRVPTQRLRDSERSTDVLPLNKLDQSMMRKLRKLVDLTGWTVENLIHEGILEFVAKHEAEKELETKIIRFPRPTRVAYKAKVKQMHTYEVRPGP